MNATIFKNKVVVLSIASAVTIFGICLMKNAMELEDAEQAYYSQWWRWGYDDQPPLYTWIQILINSVFGVSKGSFGIVRGIMFSLTLITLYKFSTRFLSSKLLATAVVLGLVFLPTFIDFNFRRLSHTNLLCLMVIVTYLVIQRLIAYRYLINYAVLGFVIAIGVLTKYNYALLLGALGISVFVSKEIREVFLNKRILLTILISMVLISPHLMWLFGNAGFTAELQGSVALKTNTIVGEGIPVITPIISFLRAFIKLIWPLLLVFGVLFFSKKRITIPNWTSDKWILHLFFSQVLVFLTVFIFLDAEMVEARWLLPLFLPFMVLLPKFFNEVLLLKWNRIGYFIFLILILFQIVRTPVEKAFGIESSVHYGFDEISNKLQTEYDNKEWFLPDITYAGNIRLLNQDREVYALDDFSLPQKIANNSHAVYVIKDKSKVGDNTVLKDSIMSFGKEKEDLFFYVLGN